MSIPDQLPPALLQYVEDTYSLNYSIVAGLAWLVYDTLITLHEEIELIWKRPMSLPSVLYLISRYYTLFGLLPSVVAYFIPHPPLALCHASTWSFAIGHWIIAVATYGILVLRLHALYNRRKAVMVPLFLAFGGQMLLEIVQISFIAHSTTYGVAPIPGIVGCWVTSYNTTLVLLCIAAACFATLLFVMMTIKLWASVKAPRTQGHVITLFFRDGAVSFAAILVSVIQLVILTIVYQDRLISSIGSRFVSPLFSVAATRMVLNLRNVGDTGDDGVSIATSIAFATNPAPRHELETIRLSGIRRRPVPDWKEEDCESTAAGVFQSPYSEQDIQIRAQNT